MRDNTSWFRRFHAAPDRDTQLVFLPHAGGSASYYAPFSEALSDRADVLCAQYPGRQDRWSEPCFENLTELADAVVEALTPSLDRPVVVFGHSMGATLAFEVTRRLEDAGIVPRRLFVSGRVAPHDNRDLGLHRLADDELLGEMVRLGGTNEEVLAEPELLRMVLPTVRADYQAIETYVYRPGPPLSCPVTALVGDTDPRASVEEAKAWAGYTTGDFDLKVFPGGHFYLADELPAVVSAISAGLAAG